MTTPTPGRPDAVAAGCLCPIIDNGRGERPGPWGFVVNGDCQIHAACGWSLPHRDRHNCSCLCRLRREHEGRHRCEVQRQAEED